jgi:hypothetical protein
MTRPQQKNGATRKLIDLIVNLVGLSLCQIFVFYYQNGFITAIKISLKY